MGKGSLLYRRETEQPAMNESINRNKKCNNSHVLNKIRFYEGFLMLFPPKLVV